jgi:hypothetical protein
MLISRISLRISGATVGRPPRHRDFHRQYDLNPARCHLITVSGFTIAKAPSTFGAKLYKPANIRRSSIPPHPGNVARNADGFLDRRQNIEWSCLVAPEPMRTHYC